MGLSLSATPATVALTERDLRKPSGRNGMMDIQICIGTLAVEAELNDTSTARQIAAALPIQATFNTWGDEIYFAIPVSAELDASAREVVDVGDLGYWPPGKALCIFFGPTPMSRSGEIRPASAVNIVGRVRGDATQFRQVMRERQVKLEANPPPR
jgi:uncharacterized protein